jgi:hypothetical protein
MKFVTAFVLTALLGYASGLFPSLPWYCFAVTSLVVAIAIPQESWKSFVSAFLALFVLWAVLAFAADRANGHILSVKIAQVLPLGGSSAALILVTAFIGGLVSGLAALTGSYLRKKEKR